MAIAERAGGRSAHPFLIARPNDARFEGLMATLAEMVAFDAYTIAGLPYAHLGVGTGSVLADNWPADLRRRYIERQWYADCPVVARLHEAADPFTTAAAIESVGRDDRRRRVFDAMSEELGEEIASIPIRWLGRLIGSATFRRRKLPFAPREVAILNLATPALHIAAAARWRPIPGNPLSTRERACLKEAAEGWTTPEIAERLGISLRTANAHITSAQIKLGASNRSHAIAVAINRGCFE